MTVETDSKRTFSLDCPQASGEEEPPSPTSENGAQKIGWA